MAFLRCHGSLLQVFLGGGRSKFMPSSMADPEYPEKRGDREDGRNLFEVCFLVTIFNMLDKMVITI